MPSADALEGGLRDRFLLESAHRWIRHGLTEKGWFSLDAGHAPVSLRGRALRAEEDIEPNLITVSKGPTDTNDAETGSNLGEAATELWVTIYAENEAIGIHLQGDVFAMLSGRLASIDFDTPGFQVYDWRGAADPPTYPPSTDELFWVELEDVVNDREHDPTSGQERLTFYVIAQMLEFRE